MFVGASLSGPHTSKSNGTKSPGSPSVFSISTATIVCLVESPWFSRFAVGLLKPALQVIR